MVPTKLILAPTTTQQRSKYSFQLMALPFPHPFFLPSFLSFFSLFLPCFTQLFLVHGIFFFHIFQYNEIMILLYKLHNDSIFFYFVATPRFGCIAKFVSKWNCDSIMHFFINSRLHNEIVHFFWKPNYITKLRFLCISGGVKKYIMKS